MATPPHLGLEPGVLTWSVAWDLVLGEQVPEVDPRQAVDRAVEALEGAAPQRSRLARSAYGAILALALPYAVWKIAHWLLALAARLHRSLYQEASTLLLKASLSIRSTASDTFQEGPPQGPIRTERPHVGAVPPGPTHQGTTPGRGEPEERAAWVSPSQRLVRLAQGLTGNVVGPLFYFAFLGVPGALAYHTLRALRDRWSPPWRDDPLGAFAVRLEGLASFIPARLGALLLATAARLTGDDDHAAWETSLLEAHREGRSDLSEGWTEGALAGALGVRLDRAKGPPINEGGRPPQEEDLARARRLFYLAAGGAVGAALAIAALRHAAGRRRS